MCAKRRTKSIPKSARAVALTRHFVKSLRKDGGNTYTRKARSGGTEVVERNPWPLCETCQQRNPPSAYVCGWVTHAGMCTACCGYPHPEEDDEKEGQEQPGLARDEDGEDDAR